MPSNRTQADSGLGIAGLASKRSNLCNATQDKSLKPKALELKPDYADARKNLDVVLAMKASPTNR